MSLTDWVNWDKGLIDSYFEKPELTVSGELKAPPTTKNYAIVGTAFDYAMRLKLFVFNQKLINYDANQFKMVADNGVALFPNKKRKLFLQDFRMKLSSVLCGKLAYSTLLPDCIILAKLDSLYRSGQNFPDTTNFSTNESDINDLQKLISLLSSAQWTAKQQCLLNPIFGQSSLDIGGADADIVFDDFLLDIKTTKYLEFTKGHFRQLMGYYLLNIREYDLLGKLNYLGIYFSRYGLLFKFCPHAIDPHLFFDLTSMDELPDVTNTLSLRKAFWADVENSIKEYQCVMSEL